MNLEAHEALISQAGQALLEPIAPVRLIGQLRRAERQLQETELQLGVALQSGVVVAFFEAERTRMRHRLEALQELWLDLVGVPWPGLD